MFRKDWLRDLERPYCPNPPGEVFVVVVVAAEVGEIEMPGHVRRGLRRSPIIEILGQAAVAKIA